MTDAFKLAPVSHFCGPPQYGLSVPAVPDGNVPIIGMKDLIGGRVDVSNVAKVKLNGEAYQAYGLNAGDLLLNRTNSPALVGKLAIWDHDRSVEAVFASYLVRYPIRTKIADPRYVISALHLARSRQQIERLITPGVSQANINANAFYEDVAILLPPLEQQKRIADILDAWDRAIAQTEALIDAKRRRFNWLYSELFPASGTSRPTGWEAAPITSVAAVRFSGVDKKTVDGERPVWLCNYTDVFNNRRIVADMPFMSATAKPREIEAFTLQLGDVVFTKDSETAEEIGESAVVAEPLDNVVCGYHLGVARARPDTMIGDFLALALRHPWVREEFRKAANGVTRFGLNLDVMDQVHVLFPPLDQQQRLVATLNTVEDEIELLTKSLIPLREQKMGLMQKLLTGDMRLSSMEAAE